MYVDTLTFRVVVVVTLVVRIFITVVFVLFGGDIRHMSSTRVVVNIAEPSLVVHIAGRQL